MRATEFIIEGGKGKMTNKQQKPTRGVHKFTDGEKWNADYKMFRMGLALACTDGINTPDIDYESFVGRWKMAYPYSDIEVEMLKRAYEATKTAYQDANDGNMESEELDSTHTVSPVANWMKPEKKGKTK